MLNHERKSHLLKILEETGRVVAKDVSQDLQLSEDTIRRDLRELAKEGRLKRVHGGAVPVAQANASFHHRIDIASPEKIEIGRRAALMIEPGQVVFIDGGTSALQLACQIPQHIEATIITHSPNVALELLNHEKLEVEIVGGRLYRHSIVTYGAATIAWLDRLRPDVCFIGAAGIHADAGITTGNSEEAEVKRAVIARSGAVVLLASSEKLGAVSSFEFARWSDIDGIVVSTAELEMAIEMFAGHRCEIYASDENHL